MSNSVTTVNNTSTYIGKLFQPLNYINSWVASAISGTGKYQAAIASNGPIYISNNYGTDWTIVNIVYDWADIAISGDGSTLTAAVYDGILW